MAKAPVYHEENTLPMEVEFAKLREIAQALSEFAPDVLVNFLWDAIDNLEDAAKATKPIYRGSQQTGYGVDKAKKAIACDNAIAIIKQIRALKAW